MELAKSGNIGKICVPNAMATFEEYLNDFASEDTRMIGKHFLENELRKLSGATKRRTEEMIQKVDEGQRDVYL